MNKNMKGSESFDRLFSEYLLMIEDEINRTIGEGSPSELQMMCRYIIEAGGKRLRPLLTLLACEAVKGDRRKAVPVSAAIELAHTLGIIQDDIFDQAIVRRGVKAVHVTWGTPKAILASDFLFLKMVESILKIADSNVDSQGLALKALNIVVKAGLEAVEGEYLDLCLSEKNEVSISDCIAVADKKTGSFIKAALEVGALVGEGTPQEINALRSFGENLGIAYQIVDDLLGLTGTQDSIRKDIGADVKNKRMNVVLAYALQNSNVERKREIMQILNGDGIERNDPVRGLEKILEEADALDFAKNLAFKYKEKAVEELHSLRPSPAKDILKTVPALVINRKG